MKNEKGRKEMEKNSETDSLWISQRKQPFQKQKLNLSGNLDREYYVEKGFTLLSKHDRLSQGYGFSSHSYQEEDFQLSIG